MVAKLQAAGQTVTDFGAHSVDPNFRRIARRHEKTARNFLAMITIAAIAIWLR
jgi:transposase